MRIIRSNIQVICIIGRSMKEATIGKICIIEVYIYSIILISISYINDAIIDKQSSINQILWYLT